jgi:DNA-binding MarR family transcriptional regulator
MSLPRMWDLFGAEHLPYRLLLLARMIDRQAARQLSSAFGLTLAEWRVLAFVCASGPSSASTIGRSGGIDRAEISRAVSRLEDRKLAVRESDRDNRRKLIISPTGQGKSLFAKVIADRRAFFRALLQDIPEADRLAVERSMRAMASRLHELDTQPPG